ncbi:hypothetical protein E4U36_005377 [Claviceps purpurea]|nr:hypothetical protein E4U36_005377 [Claviceps purpurea]
MAGDGTTNADSIDLPHISRSRELNPMTARKWIVTIVQPSMQRNGFEPGAPYDSGTAWSKLKGFTGLVHGRGSLSCYKCQ